MSRLRLHSRRLSAVMAAGASFFGLAVVGQANAAAPCDRYVAPYGSDTNAGTLTQPYRTTAKLAAVLTAGQTGCYRAGEFRHSGTVNLDRVGTADAPITIRGYPGEDATVHGRLVLRGAHTVVEFLRLRDSIESGEPHGVPSPQILADHVTIQNTDISNDHTSICAAVSTQSASIRPRHWKFLHNRVHGCGRLPATNKDHGLYVSQSMDGEVAHNLFYDNADRGIQLYPNADHIRVHHNVVADNGEGIIFGGASVLSDGTTGGQSDHNIVENNVVVYSRIRDNVESHWGGGAQGTGNIARRNCVWMEDRSDGINLDNGGFDARDNTVAEPGFVNRSARDYRLRSDSACRKVLGTSTVGPPSEGDGSLDPVGGTSVVDSSPAVVADPAPLTVTAREGAASSAESRVPALIGGPEQRKEVGGSSCARSTLTLVVPRVGDRRIRSAIITVDGRRVAAQRRRGRMTVTVRRHRLVRKVSTVRMTVSYADGTRKRVTRRIRACT